MDGAVPAIVAFNTGDEPETIDVAAADAGLTDGARVVDRLGSGLEGSVTRGRLRLLLPPRTSAVLLP